MSEIKKYEPCYNGSPVVDMAACSAGRYVLYADHVAEIERITKLAENLGDALSRCVTELDYYAEGGAHAEIQIADAALKAWRERKNNADA